MLEWNREHRGYDTLAKYTACTSGDQEKKLVAGE